MFNKPDYFGSGVYIVKAIKKYGKVNFTKEILESVFASKEDLDISEIKWIAHERKTNNNGTYNAHDGGQVSNGVSGKTFEQIYGKERSEILKKRISDTLKSKGVKPPSRLGHKGSEKQKMAASAVCKNRIKSNREIQSLIARTAVSIECVETGVRYSSAKEASEKLGISRGNLSSVLTGKRKSAGGFTFKYLEKK